MGVDPLGQALPALGGETVPLALAAQSVVVALTLVAVGPDLLPGAGDQALGLQLAQERVEDAGGEAELAVALARGFLAEHVAVLLALGEKGEHDQLGGI